MIVDSRRPEVWASAIDRMISDRDLARKMGGLANVVTVETQPSWHEVLVQNLEPIWLRAARERVEIR
jgi:hypothetical protein